MKVYTHTCPYCNALVGKFAGTNSFAHSFSNAAMARPKPNK
jgi:hypothetical protein